MWETVYKNGKYQIVKTTTTENTGTLFAPGDVVTVDKYVVKYADDLNHTSQFGWFNTLEEAKQRLNELPQ